MSHNSRAVSRIAYYQDRSYKASRSCTATSFELNPVLFSVSNTYTNGPNQTIRNKATSNTRLISLLPAFRAEPQLWAEGINIIGIISATVSTNTIPQQYYRNLMCPSHNRTLAVKFKSPAPKRSYIPHHPSFTRNQRTKPTTQHATFPRLLLLHPQNRPLQLGARNPLCISHPVETGAPGQASRAGARKVHKVIPSG